MTKVVFDKSNPPLGGMLVVSFINSKKPNSLEIEWAEENILEISSGKVCCETAPDVLRNIARLCKDYKLQGKSPLEKTQVDNWLCYTLGPLSARDQFSSALNNLNKVLGPITFLVGKHLTIADFAIFASLFINSQWQSLVSKNVAPSNVLRWYKFMASQDFVKSVIDNLTPETLDCLKKSSESSIGKDESVTASGRAREGKFVELPGAEMGKVVVRFPPEASGYLHIGHAKAALLNQYYQQSFEGKLIMRFDDTNPAKENTHFEEVILEDVAMLQIKPDRFTYSSDYFDLMLQYCEKMLKEGTAYVDDTDPEVMKQERAQRMISTNRNNDVAKNFKMWEEMKIGTAYGQKCCVRAKIDMASPNGCLRDPTIYRCKNEAHPRTGTKYKVYPTYDFACPIVDSVEGVTHTLRTMEYHDRDPQFYWFTDVLGLRKPYIWEYSRLSMTNTVLSKRKLTWFVEQGLVDGWDDPRMPTVRGVLRRGMTVEGLKEFIIAQGSSRSVVFMEWDKIWAFNKKVIDPIAPRYTVVDFETSVPVNVKGVKEECLTISKHPKNSNIGTKSVWVGPKLLIDKADADSLKEGENATFINWGNLMIKKINKQDGKITSVEAEPNLENKDYKKTLKLTFLCDTSKAKFTPTFCVYYDHIISKPLLDKDEDFKKYINHDTRKDVQVLGDPELRNLKEGDIIEIQRKGFFRVDVPFGERNVFSCKEQPVILIYVPDGSVKKNPIFAGSSKQESCSKKEAKVTKTSEAQRSTPTSEKTAVQINEEIIQQGNSVRDLKAKKADKTSVDAAVKSLLSLKADYLKITGTEWKPGCVPPAPKAKAELAASDNGKSAASLNEEIIQQGNKVRELKAKKAGKADVDGAVKNLLSLKAEYLKVVGEEWKPGCVPPNSVVNVTASASEKSAVSLNEEIIQQGNIVRDLKAKKAGKADIDTAVKKLLALKQEYSKISGSEWKPGCVPPSAAVAVKQSGSVEELNRKIEAQGEKVRQLKSQKAEKSLIDAEVKILLSLKAAFKDAAGKEWKLSSTLSADTKQNAANNKSLKEKNLLEDIEKMCDQVRKLKSDKASKSHLDSAINVFLQYKEEYKKLTGKTWTPGAVVTHDEIQGINNVSKEDLLLTRISEQGDKVRKLKSEKADKAKIDPEVKLLLELKSEFKSLTGRDWKPEMKPATPTKTFNEEGGDASDLTEKVNNQGNIVRDLKAKKASKDEIDKAVKLLLELKLEYKEITGKDFPTAGRPQNDKPAKAPKEKKETKPGPKEKKPLNNEESSSKKQTRLCLEAKKEEDLPNWYSQVITKGELIEYYDVSGCYIYRPWSYSIWEAIKEWFDREIKKLGVQNCYFPIFVSKAMLEKEKTHIADFSPEVAWVTRSGDSEMSEPIAVRPTSETVMYPAYAKWIQSYRDLPIKLNQWNNVVRWEFKHPQPFLRTREFLWQEGHTAYATAEEAKEEVSTILDLYAKVYTDLLAVPVIKGRKTEKEKFAGGDYTYTVEAYISASGRAIQGATSHHLGQNFSKMFEIVYEDPETQEKKRVYQNSWGITTRTIGVMIMIHSDNQGLILPPYIASIQVIVVPCGITASLSEGDRKKLQNTCDTLESQLQTFGIRAKGDYRTNYSPGWKFNHWELKGVPIRVELGPKDMEKNQIVAVRRDTGEKVTIPMKDANDKLKKMLQEIHDNLYSKALHDLNSHVATFKNWSEFVPSLDKKNLNLVPFCGNEECEDKIKADSTRDEADTGAPSMGAKSLCIPLDQQTSVDAADKCIHPSCSRKPQFYTLFGRSY